MVFELDKGMLKKLVEWGHRCDLPEGAIGGKLTYMFTNTELGQVVQVKCACGEVCDLTDYEGW